MVRPGINCSRALLEKLSRASTWPPRREHSSSVVDPQAAGSISLPARAADSALRADADIVHHPHEALEFNVDFLLDQHNTDWPTILPRTVLNSGVDRNGKQLQWYLHQPL